MYSYKKYALPLLMICIFAITLGIRLAFIFESESIPVIRTPTPGLDIDLHWQGARLINEGVSMDTPCFELMMCSTPLHQIWHAFWQSVLGDSMRIHRGLNAFVGAINALILFSLIYSIKPNLKISFACSIAWAMLPSLIYFDSILHKSTLELFILLLLLRISLNGEKSYVAIYCCLQGILLGLLPVLLILLQGNSFFYFPIVLLFYILAPQLSYGKKLVIVMSAISVFIACISIFNVIRPLDSNYPWFLPQKGIHFSIGFQDNADGTYQPFGDIKPWPYGHLFQGRINAEIALGKSLSWSEADQYYIDKGVQFVVEHPVEAVEIVVTKILLFFNNYEVKGVDDINYLKTKSSVLKLSPMGLGIIIIFAGLGAIHLLQLKSYRLCFLLLGFLLAMLTANSLGFISSRYRLHNVVPLTLLAAFGVEYFAIKTEVLRTSTLPLGTRWSLYIQWVLLPVSVLTWVAYHPMLKDKAPRFQKQSEINNNLSIKAEKMQSRLLELNGISLNETRNIEEKVNILVKLHRHTQAFDLLDKIHQGAVFSAFMFKTHIKYLIWLGEYEQAVALFERVKKSNPNLIPLAENGLEGIEKTAYTMFVRGPEYLNKPLNRMSVFSPAVKK